MFGQVWHGLSEFRHQRIDFLVFKNQVFLPGDREQLARQSRRLGSSLVDELRRDSHIITVYIFQQEAAVA